MIFKKGLTRQECLVSLRETFGNEASSEKAIYNCSAELRRGCASVSDESREGRPKSVLIPNNIKVMCKMIEQDRHVTYCEIEALLGISQIAILSIFHDHLAVKKICSRWISHNLIEAQKEAHGKLVKGNVKKFD